MTELPPPSPERPARKALDFNFVTRTLGNFSSPYSLFGDLIIQAEQSASRLGNDLCIPDSPGFPGSVFSTVFQVTVTIHDIARLFQQIHSTNTTRIADAIARFESSRDGGSRDPFDELVSLTTSLNSANSLPTKDAKRVIEQLWLKYAQTLAICRARMPNALQKRSSMDFKFKGAPRLLKQMTQSFSFLGDQICEASRGVQLLSRRVDYVSDFQRFIGKIDLKFSDVTPPPFDKFTFSSRYSAPDVRVIPPFTMPYFPSHIAIAKADFVPQSPDELPLKKGQIVYLMQTPKSEWVFAMTRAFAIYGWVPANFVQIKGIGSVVVLDRTGAMGFKGRQQSILILLELRDGGKNVFCEDVHGKKFVFKREAVAIL